MDINYCPFCKGRAIIEKSVRAEYTEKGMYVEQSDRWRIVCSKCGIGTPWEKSLLDVAVQKWNRREDAQSITDSESTEQG